MHPKIQNRIDSIIRSKRSEVDADLKSALSELADVFVALPILGREGVEFSFEIKRISELIDATDPNTDYGMAVRGAVVELLRRVNPRLEKIGKQISEASEILAEFRAELNGALISDQ